ncbi:Pyruvate kinase [Giardia muris]|uniref:Pyruvate kinase n=1 Tax=Giardia muris TaxID=5742 RepID=A0A4Z1T3M1_GIAMU|nr:Pyruvate kinase [Giardia muris]|eukprot:TNJ26991.1 Pyruvate kinase [Giardia muris]
MHAIHERAAKGYPGKLTAANLIAAPAYGGEDAPPYRRGKVIVTLGPGCNTREAIAQMLTDGVDAFRIMMAKATNEENLRLFNLVREVADEQKKFVPIIASLQGPKFRIARFPDDNVISLQEGQEITFCHCRDQTCGKPNTICINDDIVFTELAVGDELVFRHAKLVIQVTAIASTKDSCVATVLTRGSTRVTGGSSFRVATKFTTLAPLTDVDYGHLDFIAEKMPVDWICLSHINTLQDIRIVESYLESLEKRHPGFAARILMKVETALAVSNLRETIKHVDGVIVARGALCEEMELGYVPVAQKTIIGIAREFGKPSYVASSVCDSMYDNIIPTRAEVSDVNNALADGCDGLVLCRETAIGEFAIQAARYLIEIVTATETDPLDATYCGKLLSDGHGHGSPQPTLGPFIAQDGISISAVAMAKSLKAKCICVFSIKGGSALRLVRQRPGVPIIVFTAAPSAARWMSMLWGVKVFVVQRLKGVCLVKAVCDEILPTLGFVEKGDHVVLIAGSFLDASANPESIGVIHRGTNHIVAHKVGFGACSK